MKRKNVAAAVIAVLVLHGIIVMAVSIRLPEVFGQLTERESLLQSESRLKNAGFQHDVSRSEVGVRYWKKKSIVGSFYVEIYPYLDPDLQGVSSIAVGYRNPCFKSLTRRRYINR